MHGKSPAGVRFRTLSDIKYMDQHVEYWSPQLSHNTSYEAQCSLNHDKALRNAI